MTEDQLLICNILAEFQNANNNLVFANDIPYHKQIDKVSCQLTDLADKVKEHLTKEIWFEYIEMRHKEGTWSGLNKVPENNELKEFNLYRFLGVENDNN